MTPSPWPTELDKTTWAKSADRGEGGQPETLATHTWYVLCRLAEFIYLRPTLPAELGQPRLWHILYWAAFLHDFGKAATGFQQRLRSRESPKWPYRHEVLSLAFVDWIAADFSAAEQAWLVAAIASHHKDAEEIQRTYAPPFDDDDDDPLVTVVAQLEPDTISALWDWLATCAADWLTTLHLNAVGVVPVSVLPKAQAIALTPEQRATRIYYWLDVYRRFVKRIYHRDTPKNITVGTLTLRGYLMNADHSASAHLGKLPRVTVSQQQVLDSRKLTWAQLYEHQKQAAQAEGSVLLTAPTGSGKTEAALLWAARQLAHDAATPRLFYTLPYQASMNAMKLRLDDTFGAEFVGLQHGRALLAHYRILLDDRDDITPKDAQQQAKQARDMAKLNYPPVRIFSPYQMLKGPYRLRGYETLLSDYHHALFIFDEIHTYEADRLAMILATIQFLREHFQARFMVMSATFPRLIKTPLLEALGISETANLTADTALFTSDRFQRHQLHLLDGDVLAALDRVVAEAEAGRSVLVVCNLVARAQTAFQQLEARLSTHGIEVKLLHGRFNMRDRSALEKLIRDRVSANVTQTQPLVLVATQAVEVSLDIDFDRIFSEPAPLEALVQRFGRVNRRGSKGLTPVYVCRDWDRDKQSRVYNEAIVARTLEILERENGQPLNEHIIGDWLDEIYQGDIAATWQQDYDKSRQEFEAACLNTLKAFERASPGLEDLFYRAFDGTEVLPLELQAAYIQLKETEPIRASEFLVPIRYKQLKQIEQANRRLTPTGEWPIVVEVPYDSTNGLNLSNLSRQGFGMGHA